MSITVSKEDYIKAIAEAEADGETVISATLVRWMQVTPAAITMALRRLKRDGYVNVVKDGRLVLTSEGRKVAERVRFRHHLIERMLVEIFGMEWFKVHDEAERLEHAVSEDFVERLVERLGPEGRCPHGNDIRNDTAAHRRKRGWKTLAELEPGVKATIVSVFERDRGLLEHFDRLGIGPGVALQVVERNSDDTFTLRIANAQAALGKSGAERIWVAR